MNIANVSGNNNIVLQGNIINGNLNIFSQNVDNMQIVTLEKYIQEYNNSLALSSPLIDELFLFRDEELEKGLKYLKNDNILIITGDPGIGKTRFAIELIRKFQKDNPEFESLAISYRGVDILGELNYKLKTDNNYFLLLDDANRIDVLNQIIAFLRSVERNKIKVVLTVRNYAFETIKRQLSSEGLSFKEIVLKRFSQSEITKILKSDPLKILHPIAIRRIIPLSNGNLRIAIMAALLFKEKNALDVLLNVYDLFESFLYTFNKDTDILKKTSLQKVLGLISLIRILNLAKSEDISFIRTFANISEDELQDIIRSLERAELIEIYKSNQEELIKVTDFNLGVFFFYKSFIERDYQVFRTLFFEYFDKMPKSFQEIVTSMNNYFGPINVMDKLKPLLHDYYKTLSDDDRQFNFLDIFWFYLQDEALNYIRQKIYTENYKIKPGHKDDYPTFLQHDVLELLVKFFDYPGNNLKIALQLSFIYVSKKSSIADELIKEMRQRFSIKLSDAEAYLPRQRKILEFFEEKLTQGNLSHTELEVIKKVLPLFLKYEYEDAWSYKLTIHFSRLSVGWIRNIKEFRQKVWQLIEKIFYEYGIDLRLIRTYASNSYIADNEDIIKVIEFDLRYIYNLADKYLTKENFHHCLYIQSLVEKFRSIGVKSKFLDDLNYSFKSDLWHFYTKLEWDYLNGEPRKKGIDYKVYERKKEQELRRYFIFNSQTDVEEFMKKLKTLVNELENYNNKQEPYIYFKQLDIILDENLRQNLELGLILLKAIIENEFLLNLNATLYNHLKEEKEALAIWRTINEFQRCDIKLQFFTYLKSNLVNDFYYKELLKTVKDCANSRISPFYLKHFQNFNANFFNEIISIIINNNLAVFDLHLKDYYHLLDFNLLKHYYLYLTRKDALFHFDYNLQVLKAILEKDFGFLYEFVITVININHRDLMNILRLDFIWNLPNLDKDILFAVMDACAEYATSSLNENYALILFPKANEIRGYGFLKTYLHANYNEPAKVNLVIDIVLHKYQEKFEDIVTEFLKQTQDVELFRNIRWDGLDVKVYHGEVNFGELEKQKWLKLKEIVDKIEDYRLLEIKNLLNEAIQHAEQWAENERKQRFMEEF